jgi:hypothetical protein
MNLKHVTVVATLAVMFVAAITLLTPGNEFAYKKSQAVSQINNCGSSASAGNVWCQNTASQIQDRDDSTAPAGAPDSGITDSSSSSGGTGDTMGSGSTEAPATPEPPMVGSTFGGSSTGQTCDTQFCYSTSDHTWRP